MNSYPEKQASNYNMSSQQLIFIKRPEPSLSEVFKDMYLNERLVDVTLSCSDGQLQAHKLVLAASSPYFASLFDKLASPFQYPVIIIKDMLIDDLKLIVDFMYRGQLAVSPSKLSSLIRSAENLQISGLSDYMGLQPGSVAIQQCGNFKQTPKRPKKSLGSMNSAIFGQQRIHQGTDDPGSRVSPEQEKLLEQSMITGESSLDGHFTSYSSGGCASDATSTRNSNNQLLPVSPNPMHLSNDIDQHQQLSNQLQVLSHSLAANRSSLNQQGSHNMSHQVANSQLQQHQQSSRGRLHHCNICWKTFREKANLKRHLQVHSLDRVVYACPDCNKTFSWKDNYIRHTKTAHHINNVRPQV